MCTHTHTRLCKVEAKQKAHFRYAQISAFYNCTESFIFLLLRILFTCETFLSFLRRKTQTPDYRLKFITSSAPGARATEREEQGCHTSFPLLCAEFSRVEVGTKSHRRKVSEARGAHALLATVTLRHSGVSLCFLGRAYTGTILGVMGVTQPPAQRWHDHDLVFPALGMCKGHLCVPSWVSDILFSLRVLEATY